VCCRYAVKNDARELAKRYNAIKANFNYTSTEAFPSTYNPVAVNKDGLGLYLLKWGFLLPNGKLVINARSESISYKNLFKESFISKRCLIPANSFFEWKKTGDKKEKYEISVKDIEIFSLAGLYDNFTDKNGKTYTGFVILTTEPNDSVSKIHNRMPVILEPGAESIWLGINTEKTELLKLTKPFENNKMIIKKAV
jgi:putative SOS response-associated peptidase YedK